MFARIPALLVGGTTKDEIAAMYGVKVSTLVVLCCRRGISLRKGGSLPKRANLTLPDEPLLLSDGVLKSLREATRAMGKNSTARLVSDLLEKIASDGLTTQCWTKRLHNDRPIARLRAGATTAKVRGTLKIATSTGDIRPHRPSNFVPIRNATRKNSRANILNVCRARSPH